MKSGFKKWAITAAAGLLAVGMSMTAWADDEKISSVKIELVGEEPVAGEDIGGVSIKAPSNTNHYTLASSEDVYYTNEDDDIWERGTTPVVRVELTAKDGYYFSSMSKSKVSVSGMHGEYKTSKVMDGGSTLRVEIRLRKVAGDLTDIEENYWDGKTAEWTEIDDADKYEVKLYRGTRTVTTVTTTGHRYNFYPHMTSAGDYSFKVRAISNSDGEKSAWTELSDEFYISSDDVYTGSGVTTNPGNGTGTPGNTAGSGSSGWNQNQLGWWYKMDDGNPARANWLLVNNNWYYFDVNGYMTTGLQMIGGRWFYLNPTANGTTGAMLTGVQVINGFYYYFNPVSDGTKGAMLTGYQVIDGKWYFFDPANGTLWANRTTPDGKWIDGAGVVNIGY